MSKTTKGKKRVTFELRAEPGAEVAVAGSFNGWKASDKKMKNVGDGLFRRAVMLETGRYEYKFVIDGNWCVDPECPDWAPNELGSLNSILVVV